MACEPDTWLWHLTLYVKVTWPYKWLILSRALYMLDTWFFIVYMICLVKEVNDMWTWYMSSTRDLVHQGHVTSQVIFLILGPMHATEMNLFMFPWIVGSRESMACNPDTWLWRVTLSVKVTWPYKISILSRALYMLKTCFSGFHGSLGPGSQGHIGQIRVLDAWLCTSR